ncbi:MAG: hypothetical protein JO157_12770 [Acetobacteraceae bacterium]|nr:hypothetical protein [Acetobacteraceae bacterium]
MEMESRSGHPSFLLRKGCALVLSALAAGCGLSTPELQRPGQTYQDEQISINRIVNRVKCELIQGVIATLNDDVTQAKLNETLGGRRKLEWLKDWSAKVTLTLTAVESSAVSPGLSYANPLAGSVRNFSNGTSVSTGRAFTVGAGGSISSEATRIDKLDFFFAFKDFLPNADPATGILLRNGEPDTDLSVPCAQLGRYLESDLKLGEWLKEAVNGVYTDAIQPANGYTLPISVISHEVKFVVLQNANVNPGFRLTEFAFSQSGAPLFQAARNRTDDVLISLGPTAEAEFKPQKSGAQAATTAPAAPSQALIFSHLASEIGTAVSAALGSSP